MVRKPRNKKYNIPAYLIEPNGRKKFWCMQKKTDNITEEIGQPMGNGFQYLETPTNIKFEQEQQIEILGQTLSIDEYNSIPNTKDKNARRGKPSYITTLRVS